MTTAAKPNGLLGRLKAAQEACQPIEKKGKNVKQGYDYVRAVDVVAAVRKALHSQNLLAVFEALETTSNEITSKSGGAGLFVALRGELHVSDPETGEKMTVVAYGAGIDYPGDKAVYKAITGASKYAHAAALDLPFGEDPEEDGSHNDARVTSAPAASNGDPKPPSDKQLGFLENLLKGGGVKPDDVPNVLAYASEKLTGGRDGSVSRAIEALKSDERDEAIEKLMASTLKWQSTQTDVPDG